MTGLSSAAGALGKLSQTAAEADGATIIDDDASISGAAATDTATDGTEAMTLDVLPNMTGCEVVDASAGAGAGAEEEALELGRSEATGIRDNIGIPLAIGMEGTGR